MTTTELPDTATWTTYKRADGDLVGGEYAWVADIDFFNDEAEEVDCLEIIEERWTLVERRVIKLGRTDRWCAECDADVTLSEPVTGLVYCPEHRAGYGQTRGDAE